MGLGVALGSGVLAGGLHALSLDLSSGWLVAWVALVPLLVVAGCTPMRQTVAATIAYAIVLFEADVTIWLAPASARYFHLDPGLATALTIVGIGAGSIAYGTLLGFALARGHPAEGAGGVIWCAALWSVWDSLRTFVPPFLPAGVLGTSQAGALPVLQVASVTGIAGVTALVVAVNAALAQLWTRDAPRIRRLGVVAATVALALVAAGWGGARIARTPAASAASPRVLVVDGAARTAADSTLDRYLAATPAQPEPRPDLVVWPESALLIDLTRDAAAWDRLRRFVDAIGVPLVTGGLGTAITADGRVTRFNSVHFVRPRHGMLSYHKRVLIPVAESWPSWLGTAPAALDVVDAGDHGVVFGDGAARFGPLVCFEITDPASARELAARGARFLVNVNNDVWFAGGTEPHWVWVIVRAIESGRAIVRATNGGTSAIVDAAGRVVAESRAARGPGVLGGAIPEPVDTLYVRTGEVFLPACVLVALFGVLRRRRPLTV